MLLKLYAGLGEQVYAHDRRDIFVNQYIGSSGRIPLDAGEVEVVLQSDLPWQGTASATLHMRQTQQFGLHFRVPRWCPTVRARVNGQPQAAFEIVDGYAVFERAWQDGDIVELELAMPIQRVFAHPSVSQLHERVALRRGPLIYCVEGADNPSTSEPILAADPQLGAEYRPDMLGGVVTLVGRTQGGGALCAIPYYAWDNRKAADATQDWMAVWLKQADNYALRHQVEGDNRKDWAHKLYRPLVSEKNV
jgi:DUF1680 family protein